MCTATANKQRLALPRSPPRMTSLSLSVTISRRSTNSLEQALKLGPLRLFAVVDPIVLLKLHCILIRLLHFFGVRNVGSQNKLLLDNNFRHSSLNWGRLAMPFHGAQCTSLC